MTDRSGPDARRIGRYRVVRRIGAGGMGEVLLGWDEQLQRPVALKGLPADVRDESLRYRLRREALATAAISHPAIAHVYEVLDHEGRDWLVMEYIDGQTIAEALRSGPLRCDEVARIGEAVARALHAAHEKGLIHRDVKAENVMVTSEGHVKVLDFGLAKRSGGSLPVDPKLTLDGAVLGTTRAMSPEQALGRALDARSDVFSLGSLLYEMATGRPAFRGETAAETLVRVARGEYASLDAARLPPELVAIVARCLAVDPGDRFPTAGDVADALRRLRATATHGTAALPSAVLAPPATGRRWRSVAAAALAAALLAIAAGVLVPALRGPGVVVVGLLPAAGTAADPLVSAVVDDALRAALAPRSGVILVPDPDLRPCLAGGGSAADLARQVAAGELLECSVARGGDTLRVTLARVAASRGRILWSGQAETDPDALLQLQAELASLVDEGFRDRPARGRTNPRELSADALAAYARALVEGDGPAARRDLERAVELAPRWVEPRLALFAGDRDAWLATRASQRLDACRDHVARAQALAPSDPGVAGARVQLAVMEGRTDEAVAAARAARDERAADPGAAVRLALVLALAGDSGRTRASFAQADGLGPSWSVPFARAHAMLALGDDAEADVALAEALQRSPDNPAVLGGLLDLALRRDDLVAADRWARQAAAVREDGRALLQLGLVVLLQGRPAEAADLLRRATDLEPASPTAAVELAAALSTSGEPQAARAAAVAALLASDRRLAGDAGDPAARAARARALALLGRGPEAALVANELQIERRGDPEAALAAALTAAVIGDANNAMAALYLAVENGLPRAHLRRPELQALDGLPSLARTPPRPAALRFVLPVLR